MRNAAHFRPSDRQYTLNRPGPSPVSRGGEVAGRVLSSAVGADVGVTVAVAEGVAADAADGLDGGAGAGVARGPVGRHVGAPLPVAAARGDAAGRRRAAAPMPRPVGLAVPVGAAPVGDGAAGPDDGGPAGAARSRSGGDGLRT